MSSLNKNSAGALIGVALGDAIVQIRYRQDQNTAGGTATSGSDQLYPTNELTHNGIGGVVALATSVLTLPAGTYFLTGWATVKGVGVGRCQIWLDDGTATPLVVGHSGTCVLEGNMLMPIAGKFTLAVQTDITVQYRVANTKTTSGLGAAANWGEEVYGDFTFMKVS